jgi:hypothetical protein
VRNTYGSRPDSRGSRGSTVATRFNVETISCPSGVRMHVVGIPCDRLGRAGPGSERVLCCAAYGIEPDTAQRSAAPGPPDVSSPLVAAGLVLPRSNPARARRCDSARALRRNTASRYARLAHGFVCGSRPPLQFLHRASASRSDSCHRGNEHEVSRCIASQKKIFAFGYVVHHQRSRPSSRETTLRHRATTCHMSSASQGHTPSRNVTDDVIAARADGGLRSASGSSAYPPR